MSATISQPRSMPRGPMLIFGALALVGIVTFGVGLSQDPERAYRVYLHNWLMWAVLAQGALVLSSAMRLTNANWQGPIHRVLDSMGAFVPLSLLLFVVVWIGRSHLFQWVDPVWAAEHIHGKELWLSDPSTFLRDVVLLAYLAGVSKIYLYMSIRPTLGAARDNPSTPMKGMVDMWTRGWRGEAAERALAEKRCRKMAAVVALSFTIGYSFIATDMIMSLAPHWISTMFPAYFAWGGFLSAVSLATLILLFMRNSDGLAGQFTESRRHDMGKMIFAFSIFWMYLFWSQYLVIWYGNIPEETSFIVARLGTQFVQDTWYLQGFWTRISEPYVKLTLVTWILLWVVPFWVLLGQKPKKTPIILGTVAFGSLFGFWIERYILVTPSLITPEQVLAGAAVTPFGWMEIGVALGFVGLFFLCFLAFAKVFPGAIPAKS